MSIQQFKTFCEENNVNRALFHWWLVTGGDRPEAMTPSELEHRLGLFQSYTKAPYKPTGVKS